MWKNLRQPIIATEDHGWFPDGKILWMDETFPDETEKIR